MKMNKHLDNQACESCTHFPRCYPQIAFAKQTFCVYTPSRFSTLPLRQAVAIAPARRSNPEARRALPSW